MNWLISAICAGNINYQACAHAVLNATAYSGADKVLIQANEKIKKELTEKISNDIANITAITYTAIVTRNLEITLPSEKVLRIVPSDHFRVRLNESEALISLVWNF